jgi:hypothetical protein
MGKNLLRHGYNNHIFLTRVDRDKAFAIMDIRLLNKALFLLAIYFI